MGSHNGMAISLGKTSEVVISKDKAVHPNVVFWSHKQGVVAMMRTLVSFSVKKRIHPIEEI